MVQNGLTSLPPEILYEIASYVGADEFRQCLDRLTLCRQWYDIAMMVMMKDLKLGTKGVKSLPALQNTLPISRHLHSLSVRLQGFTDWSLYEDPITPRAICQRFNVLRKWTEDMAYDMGAFADWMANLQSVENFRFEAIGEHDPGSGIQSHVFGLPRDYLHEKSVAFMLRNLPSQRLKTLHLDTCGSSILSSRITIDKSDPIDSEEHICSNIAKHVNSLQNLRVRMHHLCPDMFGLDHLQPSDEPKSFVFHLTMFDPLKRVPTSKCASHCRPELSSREALISVMNEATKKAIEKVPKLSVTVLYHESPSALISIDCRTGIMRSLNVDDQSDWLDIEDIATRGEQISPQPPSEKTAIYSIG